MDIETKEYLINARKSGISVKAMMAHLGKSESTVELYLKELGLTVPGNLDISSQTVLAMHKDGMTCSEIARHFGISHAAVTDRLAKHGVKPDSRADGIRKHFARTYAVRWPAAKALLDDGMSFSKTALAMHMRPENLRRMMRENAYHKPERGDTTGILDVLRDMANDPNCNAKRRVAAKKYYDGITSYLSTFGTLPQASHLARHMGISVQTVSSWFEVQGLEGMLARGKQSYLLSAVLGLLDDMAVRYDLNRRNLISPYEIDVWLYDFGAGIEVNPVTTHSPDTSWGKRSITYHQEKSMRALDAGIAFVQVYDFDLTDGSRWQSFREWVSAVKDGRTQPAGDVDLDRFLKGATSSGVVSDPDCVWVNPNTLACEFSGDPVDLSARHFCRVYTAGRIRK